MLRWRYMFSWRRLSVLVERAQAPLFLFGEGDQEDPIVVLSLKAYEMLIQNTSLSSEESRPTRIPVRFGERSSLSSQEAKSPASDLDAPLESSLSAQIIQEPTYEGRSSGEDPPIMTPPASLLDERRLEERFYFHPPVVEEYG